MNLRRTVPHSIVILAAVALYGLLASLQAAEDPWRPDEAYTEHVAGYPARETLAHIPRDLHPPLFYLAATAARRLTDRDGTLKLIPMAAGLVALLAAARALREISGERAAEWAALLLASFPLFLYFAQDFRMYAPALAAAMIALAGGAAALRGGRRGPFALAAGTLLLLYLHNHGLLVAAAFWSGLWACRAPRLRAAMEAGSRRAWIAAAAAVALLYAPWVPVLLIQLRQPPLEAFAAPGLAEVLDGLLRRPFGMNGTGPAAAAAWLPGALLLAALPLAGLFARSRRNGATESEGDAPLPGWLLPWIGLAPGAVLVVTSWAVRPVVDLQRHSILFVPFLLLAAAPVLARWTSGGALRAAAGGVLLSACAAFAFRSASRAQDYDFRPVRDALTEKSPPGVPFLTLPANYMLRPLDLLWRPLPLAAFHHTEEVPAETPRMVLMAVPGTGPDRNEILDQARALEAMAERSTLLFENYEIRATLLDGVPPGAARAAYGHKDPAEPAPAPWRLGDWSPSQGWSGEDLARLFDPPGNTKGAGAAASASGDFRLAIPPAPAGLFTAFAAEVRPAGPPGEAFWNFAGGPARPLAGLPGTSFLIAGLTPGPGDPGGQAFEFQGAAGLEISWAGLVPLPPERFRREGFDGVAIDAGALGDELFLREGFHAREGSGAAMVRWTEGRFEIELPVFPGTAPREAVLWGMLAAPISDRAVRLAVPGGGAGGIDVRGKAEFPSVDFGMNVIRLDAPLEPGVRRLVVELGGVWRPAETGAGGDPRSLGFYLDAAGLR